MTADALTSNKKGGQNMLASFDRADEVPFNQLPEQLRKHYQGLPNCTFWVLLKETQRR